MVDNPTTPDPLLPRIEAAMKIHDLSATAFGYAAVGDPAIVGKMRKGMHLRQKRRERVEAYLTGLETEAIA
jgi:hypothetical protein